LSRPECFLKANDPVGASIGQESAAVRLRIGADRNRGAGNLIKEDAMLIVHVFIHVKADQVDAFKEASLENARNSIEEPGISRFDLIQEQDDPNRFLLIEVYGGPEDAAAHKDTAHYAVWRDTVADMMAEPRSSIKYRDVGPS